MEKYTYRDVNLRGTMKRIDYLTTNSQGEAREKYANVYLPYGYNTNGKGKYNILYIMHGGGGSPDAWLDSCNVKNMLDYVIAAGEIKPLIAVFPSYYKEKIGRVGPPDRKVEREHILFFQKELMYDLLPAVEKAFMSYSKDITKDAFRESRMHRGFCGFSMGAAVTWSVFVRNLDYFSYYVPLSGDCWEAEAQGGLEKPDETAEMLWKCATESGYGIDEYFIYTATGTKDAAYEPLKAQINAMRKYPDTFAGKESTTKGNFHYFFAEGEEHKYEAVHQYLYQILPFLF